MSFSRRKFLEMAGFGAGAFALSNGLMPRLAHAAVDPDHFIIFCEMQGAWDMQLSVDTRDPALFPDANASQTGIQLSWHLLPARFQNIVQPAGSQIVFGPAMAPFAQHYDVSSIVRGISMGTLDHVVGQRYFLTGKRPAGQQARGSSVSALMAEQLVPAFGATTPEVPNLVVDSEAFYIGNENLARPWRLGGASVYELVFAFREGLTGDLPDAALSAVRPFLDSHRDGKTNCDPGSLNRGGLMSLIDTSQARAKSIIQANLSQHFDFMSPTAPDMIQLRSDFGFNQLGTPGSAAAVAYQAIKHGISQVVTIRLQDDLDTHNDRWASEQPILQEDAFTALGNLVTQLKATDHPRLAGQKLIDHTTVIVHSEFSRTPMLNALNGRDHSLLNATLLIGAGVPHNQTFGASSDTGMSPMAVNPTTGAVDPTGLTLTPELVLGAVMKNLGFDPAELRVTGDELPFLHV